ncbi:MAG: hypothetical protein M3Y85_03925 [Bacteroidota bacterium]|nr:hypothetical protein [Bacteroidota bacterium]
MKIKSILLAAAAFAFMSISCCSQPIMRSLNDISKIKANQQNYTGKPLANLLQDIEPSILRVTVTSRKDSTGNPGYFYFRFLNNKVEDSISKAGGFPMGLVVYIKEPFTWDYKSRPADKKFSWTPEDVKHYGHLTIERLRVFTGKKGE